MGGSSPVAFTRIQSVLVTAEEARQRIAQRAGTRRHWPFTARKMIDFSGQNAMRARLALILGRIIPRVGSWIPICFEFVQHGCRVAMNEGGCFMPRSFDPKQASHSRRRSLCREKLEALTQSNHGIRPHGCLVIPNGRDRISALTLR